MGRHRIIKYDSRLKGEFATLADLQAQHPVANIGDTATVNGKQYAYTSTGWGIAYETGGETASNFRDYVMQASGSSPVAGNLRMFAKTIKRMFTRDSSGVEALVCDETGWQPEFQGLACDGVDDYISIADNANLNFPATPFMQEFFVKMPSDVTTTQQLSAKGTNGFDTYIINSLLVLRKNDVAAWGNYNISAYAGKSIHIMLGWDGTNRVIYINGQLMQSAIQSTNLIETTTGNLSIGSISSSSFFKGSIYLVRFWNLALTAAEVLQLYNNGQPQNSVILSKYRGASQVNKVTNPSFTNDLTGWIAPGNHAITRITTDDATGAGACAEITATGGGDAALNYVSVASDGTAIGKRLIQFYAKSVSGNTTLNIYSNAVVNSVTLTSTWQKFTFTVEYFFGSGSLVRFYLNGAGVFRLDDVIVQKLGNVLELKGENMGHVSAIDTSGNRLHGAMNGTPALTVNPLQQKATTGVFTTNIAAGTANKDIIIPAGYYVTAITVANTLSAGNLTNVQAVLAPTGDNITLITGKTVNNAKTLTFTALADQTQSTSSRVVRVNATGNGTGGMEVMLILARRD